MDFSPFETRIGFTFRDIKKLETAFTHRSYLNENRAPGREHNERLEFLGDAVLELASQNFFLQNIRRKRKASLPRIARRS
jgi:ribonuclease-3